MLPTRPCGYNRRLDIRQSVIFIVKRSSGIVIWKTKVAFVRNLVLVAAPIDPLRDPNDKESALPIDSSEVSDKISKLRPRSHLHPTLDSQYKSILWQFAASIDLLATAVQFEAHGASTFVQISLMTTHFQPICKCFQVNTSFFWSYYSTFTSGSMTIRDIIDVVVGNIGERVLVVHDTQRLLYIQLLSHSGNDLQISRVSASQYHEIVQELGKEHAIFDRTKVLHVLSGRARKRFRRTEDNTKQISIFHNRLLIDCFHTRISPHCLWSILNLSLRTPEMLCEKMWRVEGTELERTLLVEGLNSGLECLGLGKVLISEDLARGAKEAKSAEAKVAFETASMTICLIESSYSASSIPKMSLIFIPEYKPSTHYVYSLYKRNNFDGAVDTQSVQIKLADCKLLTFP
eukprot:g49511.t1